jgi:hypothetical protein
VEEVLERHKQFTLRNPWQAAALFALVVSVMIFALAIGFHHGVAGALGESAGAGAISFIAFGLLRSSHSGG